MQRAAAPLSRNRFITIIHRDNMKIPRNQSGREFADLLCHKWDYTIVHQKGSHIILETTEPAPQRIAIPDHKNLRIGTLNAILRAIARHKKIERSDILKSLL